MCLILIGYRQRCEHPLVIAANRDEFFKRPTKSLHFWRDHPDIFAGRDEEEHGTWLGVTRSGRMAAVTNWTETEPNNDADLSRGHLVADFLKSRENCSKFVAKIEGPRYRGFNFVAYDGQELIYFSNRTLECRTLKPGIYGLSNTRLGDKWLRVIKGERKLSDQMEHPVLKNLIHTLFDPHGVEFQPAPEKHNAPCFILGERYGTRSTTALIFDRSSVSVREQTYGPMGKRLSFVEDHFAFERH
ncbi:MAG: NRDE family protein [Gammaproteobacteria bacterium]|nr:NRDE family protein [Gammaproteobacteria bacterium]